MYRMIWFVGFFILMGILLFLLFFRKKEQEEVIKTSDPDWFNKVIKHYKDGKPFKVRNDANLDLKEENFKSGIAIIKKAAGLNVVDWNKIIAVLTGIGVCAVGIWCIKLASADPEPTSKLGILTAGGIVLLSTGTLAILRALGYACEVEVTKEGFKVIPIKEPISV